MKYYLSKPLGKEEIKSIKNVTEVHMFDKPCFVQEVMSNKREVYRKAGYSLFRI